MDSIKEKIEKHKKAIVYHEQQIKKLKSKKDKIDLMAKRGINYNIGDFNKLLKKEAKLLDCLSNKIYRTINVAGKEFYVTSDGEIYNSVRKYKGSVYPNGYMHVYLNGNSDYVHRIVWKAFYGDIPDGYEIDHINTIRSDNRLENLRLVSSKQNKNNPLTIEHYKESNSRGKMKGFVKKIN